MIKEKCGLRGNYDLKKPFALDATGRPLLQAEAHHLEQDATQGGQRQGRKKPSEKRKDREGRDNKPQPQKVQPQTPPKSEAKRQRVAAAEAAPRGAAALAFVRFYTRASFGAHLDGHRGARLNFYSAVSG